MSLNSESRVCWHFVHSFQRTTWYNTKHSVSSGLKTATDGHPLTDRFTAYTLSYRLHHQEESEFWRRLRSASSHELSIPRNRLSTYGDRAFPVAAVRIWNSLPHQHITSAPSFSVCCCRSLEDILLRTMLPVITVVVPAKWHCHLWTRQSLLLTLLKIGENNGF